MLSHIDLSTRILTLHLPQGQSAQRALEAAIELLTERPDLWDWDWIVEAASVPDDVCVHHIDSLARIQANTGRRARTVLVSEDRYLHLWARVMDFQFPNRAHSVVRSMVEARALIHPTLRPAGGQVPEG